MGKRVPTRVSGAGRRVRGGGFQDQGGRPPQDVLFDDLGRGVFCGANRKAALRQARRMLPRAAALRVVRIGAGDPLAAPANPEVGP